MKNIYDGSVKITHLASFLFLLAIVSRVSATDFTQFNIVGVRITSLSPIQCAGSTSSDCLRVGVVVLIRLKSGTTAGMSTQYITEGSFVGNIRRDFGIYAPMVFRLTAEALETAIAQNTNQQVKKNAQKFLPTLDTLRSYMLGPGVTLTTDVERLIGKIADEYQRRTGDRLVVTNSTNDSVDIKGSDLSADEQKALSDAVLSVGGATLISTGTPPLFHVQFKPGKLKLWVNAFIPGRVDNLTFPLAQGTHLGETVLEGPKPGAKECFLTDQRLFSDDQTSSVRMQILVEIDLAASVMRLAPRMGKTIRVSCDKGSVQCERSAGTDKIKAKNFSSETLADGNRRYFITLEAADGNPCVDLAGISIPSPDIDWIFQISILFERSTGKVNLSFDGMIEPFPAFEMYGVLNGPKPTLLLQESPLPGSTPWNLPGKPNRAVTIVSKEIQ